MLPPNTTDWRKTVDKTTGKEYWWHRITKEVQWTTPKDITDFVRTEMEKHAKAKQMSVIQLAKETKAAQDAKKAAAARPQFRGFGGGGSGYLTMGAVAAGKAAPREIAADAGSASPQQRTPAKRPVAKEHVGS